jgi:hypothetical protein
MRRLCSANEQDRATPTPNPSPQGGGEPNCAASTLPLAGRADSARSGERGGGCATCLSSLRGAKRRSNPDGSSKYQFQITKKDLLQHERAPDWALRHALYMHILIVNEHERTSAIGLRASVA